MNKKAYINPEMDVIKIATQQMLAGSITLDDTPSTEPTPGGTLAPAFELDVMQGN